MNNIKPFSYDPEKSPKVQKYIDRIAAEGMNFSEQIRRLIENEEVKEDALDKAEQERQQIFNELKSLKDEISKIKAGIVSRPMEQSAAIEPEKIEAVNKLEQKVDKIAASPEIAINKNAMSARYGIKKKNENVKGE